MRSYQQMNRVLSEQCTVESKEDGARVAVKPPGEVASDSLQNPSDPDAGYCGHKGQGYQAQMMETCNPVAGVDGEENEKRLSLITHIKVESADNSDALIPAIEDAKDRGLGPKEVLADSLYGSEKNVEAAAAMETEVVAPVPGGQKKSKSSYLSEFALTEQGEIAACPMGHAPIEDTARGNHREAVFAVEHCLGCPRRKECPVKPVRKGYGFSYDRKQIKMARRRARERTAAFRDRYRFRAGIEGTFSALDRKTGVKHLQVRGLSAVRFAVVLKALGLNLLRAAAVWSPENGGRPAQNGGFSRLLPGIASVHGSLMLHVRSVINCLAGFLLPAPFAGTRAA